MVAEDYLNSVDIREESEDFNAPNGETSIKEIVLRQIRKIGDICAKEFTGGYWQERPVKTAGGVMFTKEYHEDVREAYCVAVEFIVDLVYSYADETLKKAIDAEETKKELEIKEKLSSRRKIFRELNCFFNRDDFFSSDESGDE